MTEFTWIGFAYGPLSILAHDMADIFPSDDQANLSAKFEINPIAKEDPNGSYFHPGRKGMIKNHR